MKNTFPPFLLAGFLLFASAGVVAAPRVLLPAESRIGFIVKEMGVPVTGEFTRFEALLDITPDELEKSSAKLRIAIGSLTTENDEADQIAVSPDWLDQLHAPYATFQSAEIRALGSGKFRAIGRLNIRNKTRDLTMQFNLRDQTDGKTTIDGEFVIHRSDFGIGSGEWNQGDIVNNDILVKVLLTLAARVSPPHQSKPTKQ